MRTDDIEAGHSSRPSLGRRPVVAAAREGTGASDKVDDSHVRFDATDLPEALESSSWSTASFRTSKADLEEGTANTCSHPASQIQQTACPCWSRRATYIVGALLVAMLVTTALVLCLYFVTYNHNNNNNNNDQYQDDSLPLWTWSGNDLSVEGDGSFGDQVFVSDDGNRIAVYSYTGTAPVMGSNSAVTFYDRRLDSDSKSETPTWVQVARLLLDNNDTDSGPVVAVSGDGTMVAAAYPRSSGQDALATFSLTQNDNMGKIEIMPVGSGLYIMSSVAADSQSHGDFGGTSLAFSKNGTRMVVGAGGSSYGTPGGNYAVVYDLVDGDWAQTGNVLHGIVFYKEDPTPSFSSQSRLDLCQENLGATVAMSSNGKRIALAAPNSYVCDLSRAGGVYVYEQDKDTNEWMQVGTKIQLEGLVRNDAIGSTLSISDDGNRLAIGTQGKLAAVVELNSETRDWEIVGEVFNLYSEQPAADLLT
jgi:hypothetical protein